MLTCIACSKQLNGGSLQRQDDEDVIATTPARKQSLKSLTNHIKYMAIKASGAYKSCKPCSGGRNENLTLADSDMNSMSERYNLGYHRTGSSNSTPRIWGKHLDGRIKVLSSAEGTPVSLSARTESVIFTEEDEPKEWVAQVEPGILITLVSVPQGGNDLKRIRFSRELFNKWQAQRWWAENYEKVIELYNVQRFSEQTVPAPPHSEDENSKFGSAEGSPGTPPSKESVPRSFVHTKGVTSTPKLSYTSPLKKWCGRRDIKISSWLSGPIEY